MKAFLLNFLLRGGFLLTECFHIFSGKKSGGLRKISVSGGSPHRKIGWRSSCFALCLFIYLLFVYLKGAVCWVMHQLCGLALLEGGGGGYLRGVSWRFWWLYSGLLCSPVGLMQDVMRSLPSILTCCYYCLYLFMLMLSIVSV